jgi:hypothetical protein
MVFDTIIYVVLLAISWHWAWCGVFSFLDAMVMRSNKSLQATAMRLSVLTVIEHLIIIIPSQARLPWLCLSSRR